ncbi:MAG: SIR2 family protein, partial [Pseudomonadales bacterium]|nr:SIR2 family protein [Pseudomonadales bacterium]
VINLHDHSPIPADSDSLILAMTGGQPMPKRLMVEFPRAAMHMEHKKGRSFVERFLDRTYKESLWTHSALHGWLASLHLPYIIDFNRDTQLQSLYVDRQHTLIVGVARITGRHERFKVYCWDEGRYQAIPQENIDPRLPILFKPLGSPLPTPCYIASDADYVDYITELMGGFAIPGLIKSQRQGKRYLMLGMRFTRDTERMLTRDFIIDAAKPAGWALIKHATEKEIEYCLRQRLQGLSIDCSDLISLLPQLMDEAKAQTAE